jgi:hypothetical protein
MGMTKKEIAIDIVCAVITVPILWATFVIILAL